MSLIWKCYSCGWEGEEPNVVVKTSKWDFDNHAPFETDECPQCGGYVEQTDPEREERNRLKWEEVKGDIKVVRDGQVAVLISRGYGAGWSTWNYGYESVILFHPLLVKMVEEDRQTEITPKWLEDEMGLTDIFTGGVEGLSIQWLPEGTHFLVDEYDGSESITTKDDLIHVA